MCAAHFPCAVVGVVAAVATARAAIGFALLYMYICIYYLHTSESISPSLFIISIHLAEAQFDVLARCACVCVCVYCMRQPVYLWPVQAGTKHKCCGRACPEKVLHFVLLVCFFLSIALRNGQPAIAVHRRISLLGSRRVCATCVLSYHAHDYFTHCTSPLLTNMQKHCT